MGGMGTAISNTYGLTQAQITAARAAGAAAAGGISAAACAGACAPFLIMPTP